MMVSPIWMAAMSKMDNQTERTALSVIGLHIPCDGDLASVTVDERDAISYYPYVQAGPVEAAQLSIEGLDLALYVNSRYPDLDDTMVNHRASYLFELAGVGMFGGAVRGDALVLLPPGMGEYDRSLPPEILKAFLGTVSDD